MTRDEAIRILGAARWHLDARVSFPLVWAIEHADHLAEAWALTDEFTTMARIKAYTMTRPDLVLALAAMARAAVPSPYWQGAYEAAGLDAAERWARGEMSLDALQRQCVSAGINSIPRAFARLAAGAKPVWASKPDIGELVMDTVASIADPLRPAGRTWGGAALLELANLMRAYFPPPTIVELVESVERA